MAQANVKIAVDATSAVNKLRQVNTVSKKLSSSTDKLERSVQRNNRRFRETGAAARSASAGVNRLGAAFRKLLIGFSLFKTASFVIFNTQQIESQRKSLEVLTGSLEDTNKIIAEIQAFGAVTPFKSSDLIETTKRLKAFGFETEELVDVTKRLADVAGATGADLGGIATAFGQIQAKGRLQGEELLQLQERGVSLQDELIKMYGFTADEFRKALEGGRISADAVNVALQRITDAGGKYANGAIAQSTTLAGKFSTLVDGVESLARTFGEVLDPVLKAVLNNTITVINTINKALNIAKLQSGLGLNKEARKRIQDQARDEAKEIVNLRRIANPFERNQEFQKVFAERTLDLTKKFGFQTGQLQVEIDSPQTEDATVPELLKKTKIETSEFDKQVKLIERKNELLTARLEGNEKEIEQKHREMDLVAEIGIFEAAKIFKLQEGTRKLEEQNRVLDRQKELFTQIGDNIATGITDALVGAIEGTRSLGEAAKAIVNDLASSLLRLGINTLLSRSFGGIFSNLPGLANGGPASAGRSYLVGERGPEIFTPKRSGTVTPNNKIGGSGGVVNNINVNVDASGSSVEGDTGQSQALGRQLATAIQTELLKQKRPGGLLA
nr:phage tape measure protein [uncultured Mediterranean phage uvMED]